MSSLSSRGRHRRLDLRRDRNGPREQVAEEGRELTPRRSIASFLLPIFASYKALKTSDPAQLTPWLMYWVVFACALLVESWTEWFLSWYASLPLLSSPRLPSPPPSSTPRETPHQRTANPSPRIPFYAYLRLGFLLYLVLPQTQGARLIYQTHVHPYLSRNEAHIEDLIATAHDRLRSAGVEYLRAAASYVRTRLLGLPVAEAEPEQREEVRGAGGYTQALLARFSVPSARWAGTGAGAGGAGDVVNFFASAVAGAVSAGTGNDTASGLIPSDLQGTERATFIEAQRARLASVLAALDTEAKTLEREDTIRGPGDKSSGEEGERPASRLSSWSGMSKSRSEVDFEKIDAESGGEEEDGVRKRKGGGWMPFRWGVGPTEREGEGQGQGESSGVEK